MIKKIKSLLWGKNKYYICFMTKGRHNDEVRVKAIEPELKTDLKKISDKKGYPTLTAFLRVALIEIRETNKHLLTSQFKPS